MNALLVPLLLSIAGCVTVTPRASKIMIYSQLSPMLEKCTKVGPVTAEASAWDKLTYDEVAEQAKNNLRDSVAAQYGDRADSVALVNIDKSATHYVANGVAYKCF